ncbi:MAG: YceI family protein [Cytophagales bacterium]
MKVIVVLFLVFGILRVSLAQIYTTDNGLTKFEAIGCPDNIKAESKKTKAAFNIENKEVAFSIEIMSFDFKNKLMKEHFNENYMESEKFPKANFTGIIISEFDSQNKKQQNVKVKGNLTIHGITQEREFEGTIEIMDSKKIKMIGKFEVKFADHKIDAPKILYKTLTESALVTVEALVQLKN